MNPDTLTTPTPETTSTPVSAETTIPSNPAEKDLATKVDALDVLKPEEGIKTIANLDFKTEEVTPPPAEAAAETPEAKPAEKVIETLDPGAEAPAEEPETTPVDETADTETGDDAPLTDEEQKVELEKVARMKTLMQQIVQDERIPRHLIDDIIKKASEGGIDLDPRKPLEEKSLTGRQRWAIGIVGALLFALNTLVKGAASAAT